MSLWEVELQIHSFLISTLVGDDRSESRPGHFFPGNNSAGTQRIGGCLGTRARLGATEKTYSSFFLPGIEARFFERPLRSHYIHYALPAKNIHRYREWLFT
jgi:hypothetical protein